MPFKKNKSKKKPNSVDESRNLLGFDGIHGAPVFESTSQNNLDSDDSENEASGSSHNVSSVADVMQEMKSINQRMMQLQNIMETQFQGVAIHDSDKVDQAIGIDHSSPDLPLSADLPALRPEVTLSASTHNRSSLSNVIPSGHTSFAPTGIATVPSSPNVITNTAANDVQPHEHRRLHDLPWFSGRPEEWPMFVSSFRSTTDAFRYTDLENLIRLQKCLSGDARRTVECLLIKPRHVNNVITVLEDVFERQEVLIRSKIQMARQLPQLKRLTSNVLALLLRV